MKINYFIAVIISIAIYVMTFGKFLISKGTLIYLDHVPQLYPEKYFEIVFNNELNTWGAVTIAQLPFKILQVIVSKIIGPYNFLEIFYLMVFIIAGIYTIKIFEMFKIDKIGYLSIVILLFNPFIYLRITSGQMGIVVATLLSTVFIYYLIKYYSEPRFANALKLSFSYTFASMFQAHYFIMNFIIFVLYSIIRIFRKRNSFKELFLALFLIVMVNIYWIIFIPILKPISLKGVEEYHMEFFKPKPSIDLSQAIKLAGLFGFWREVAVEKIIDKIPFPLYILFISIFVYLIVYSFLTNYKNDTILLFFILFFLGIFLGIFSETLSKYIFIFKAFRDSHKFCYFVLLSYVILIPFALRKISKKHSNIILPIFAAFLLIYNYPQIFLHDQIKPIDYPKCYKDLGSRLNNLDDNVLYLPFRIYMTYNWSLKAGLDGRIANPINALTKNIVFVGCDPRFDFCTETKIQREMKSCLKNKDIECLKKYVKYVIIDDCAFVPENYNWINGDVIFKCSCLRLLRIN